MPKDYPSAFKALCARLVDRNPDARPTIAEAAAALRQWKVDTWGQPAARPSAPVVPPPLPRGAGAGAGAGASGPPRVLDISADPLAALRRIAEVWFSPVRCACF